MVDNNPFFMKLYNEINTDFITYSPDTSEEERNSIITRAFKLFSSNTFPKVVKINFKEEIENPIKLFSSTRENNMFMFRTLQTNMDIPHIPPDTYKIYKETSFSLFENYSKTLEYLSGKFYINDLVSCRETINKFREGRILCWSNTNILLNHLLQTNYQKLDLDIITYGSPILIPLYDCIKSSVNLYHEDDWMLGFISALYNLDISTISKDKLIEVELSNNQVCKMVIISKNKFVDGFTLPHRYYYAFF